jgi:hypothetical protein
LAFPSSAKPDRAELEMVRGFAAAPEIDAKLATRRVGVEVMANNKRRNSSTFGSVREMGTFCEDRRPISLTDRDHLGMGDLWRSDCVPQHKRPRAQVRFARDNHMVDALASR